MNSKIKQMGQGVLIVIISIISISYLVPISLNFFLTFSKIHYQETFSLNLRFYLFWGAIYSITAFIYNCVVLIAINKNNFLNKIIQQFIDILLIPLSILILVIYYNNYGTELQGIDSLIDKYLIAALVFFKHIMILLINKRFFVGRNR